ILKDGSLDISNNVLDKLDIVGAAIHSNFNLSEDIQTERLIKAAQNPSVDIIFHPTGRIINKREGYPINISKLLSIALETDTILRRAIKKVEKLVIASNPHHPLHVTSLKFGIEQPRRGWAKRGDILITLSENDLLKNLKKVNKMMIIILYFLFNIRI